MATMKVKVRTREIWVQMKTNNSLMRRLKGLLTSGWLAFPLLIHCCRPGQSGYAQIRQKMNDTMVTVLLCHYRIKVLAHQQDHLSYFLSRRSQASTKRMLWNQSCWPKYPACYRYFTSYFFFVSDSDSDDISKFYPLARSKEVVTSASQTLTRSCQLLSLSANLLSMAKKGMLLSYW